MSASDSRAWAITLLIAGLAPMSASGLSLVSGATPEGGAVFPAGPQPRWTTLADGPWLSGNAEPTCEMSERSHSVFVDPSGEIYVGGFLAASRRFFILKFSASGDLLWQRAFSTGASTAREFHFFHRRSGEPRVGFVQPVYLGYAVTTLSSGGAEAWTSTLLSETGSRPYNAASAVLADDGDVYVVGARDYGGGFVARHSGGGPPDWVTGESGFVPVKVALAGDTGVIVEGPGFDHHAVARYDLQGNRVWMRELIDPAGREMYAADFHVSSAGVIYLAGASCKSNLCRPAMAALDTDGEWNWIRLPVVAAGTEEAFRFVAVGAGRVHGLLEREDSSTHFVDVESFTTEGQWLGARSFGPAAYLASAAPTVDSQGWLRFTGAIHTEDGQGFLLAALSPTGEASYGSYRPESSNSEGGCDLTEGLGGRVILVGRSYRYADEDLFVGSFEPGGAPIWTRREPDLESPNDRAGWAGGPPRQSPAALRATDGSYWVVGDSRRGQTNQTQPVGWHFSSAGAFLGAVAPFGQTGYPQPATGAAALADGGMAMAGSTSQGVQIPFVAGFSAAHEELFRLIDSAADRGLSRDLFRRANGDLLVTEYAHSAGEWHTDVVRLSPAGVPLARIEAGGTRMVPNASVFAADESVWVVGGPLNAATQDCSIAGVSPEGGPLWSEVFGDPVTHDFCSSIDALDGRIVLGGTVAGTAVVKSFTADGTLEWSVEGAVEPGEAWGRIDEIVLDGGGNLYLSGRKIQSFETRLAKLSPEGEPLWSLPDGFLSATVLRFAVGADGAVYALRQLGVGFPELYRFDGAGEVIWMSLLPQPYEAVTADSGGRLVLTGSTFNGHSYDLLVSVLDVAGFLFADGFETGDMTSWVVETP